ncbi:MAG: NAD(P)/FAD-dependent oxidoreductase [Paracoccus sp. (in: a-proteobacteria)]|uniref:flavin-containing monooxygenase n=1 Tax=Paracoccus sp. TaxID=267 RepID=UPI0039E60D65
MTDIIHTNTLILGAGFGGLGMGAQLARDNDRDFLILEQTGEVGGVWRDNSYPGAACDTEALLYCYSFYPHLGVSRMYAARDELLAYQKRLAEAFGLYGHIRFGTRILRAEWRPQERLWHFTTGTGQRYSARFFVPAWGQLNQPLMPDFPGRERFRGQSFHSAEWRHDLDLTGKRVASIGNAASAVQYVPEIAPQVGHLTVFQRSANWIMPRNQIVFDPELVARRLGDPALFEGTRQELHAFRESGYARTRQGTAEKEEGMRIALEHLAAQVPDPELRAKLTPDYEFGCKRILRSDDYFPALMRGNVTLETAGIREITETGITTADGRDLPFDVIIWGTGFASQAFHGDLQVIGEGGRSLSDAWAEGAAAYIGLTVPGFPNMFMIYGPNTNLNHNSIITMLEIQQDYVKAAQKALPTDGAAAVRPEVFAAFNRALQEEMAGSSFSTNCSSWYKNAAGKVINNWSGTVDAYRSLAVWNPADYEIA